MFRKVFERVMERSDYEERRCVVRMQDYCDLKSAELTVHYVQVWKFENEDKGQKCYTVKG